MPSPKLQPDAAAHPGMRPAEGDLSPSQLPLLSPPRHGALNAQDLDLGGLSKRWRQPRDDFEEARLDYILTDLDECLTLAVLIEAEYKTRNREHAERSLVAIEECYSDMLRSYHQAEGLESGTRAEFESKFKRVRERLDRMRQ